VAEHPAVKGTISVVAISSCRNLKCDTIRSVACLDRDLKHLLKSSASQSTLIPNADSKVADSAGAALMPTIGITDTHSRRKVLIPLSFAHAGAD
jgi:hypothetical protein